MRFNKVQDWLDWQLKLHHQEIDLGLERVKAVADRLGIDFICPVITVAGTNGKGSTVAFLQSVLLASGQRTGCYTSPHIHRYHERMAINGVEVTDEQLLAAFDAIDQARNDESLSYFEFGTLAALWLFMQQPLDVVVLEVGLGGRLDAVNIIDADIAVITHIALDHVDWLGDNLDLIAREKAGIARENQPLIIADPAAPKSLLEAVVEKGAVSIRAAVDYSVTINNDSWGWRMGGHEISDLPLPALQGEHQIQNAAGALTALMQLPNELKPDISTIRSGLRQVYLPGRFEVVAIDPLIVLDVAHNPDSIVVLAQLMQAQKVIGKTHLLIGVMQDKDAAGMITTLEPYVDFWHVSAAKIDRAMPGVDLKQVVTAHTPANKVFAYQDLTTAFKAASQQIQPEDRLVVTGSFFTVAEVRSLLL